MTAHLNLAPDGTDQVGHTQIAMLELLEWTRLYQVLYIHNLMIGRCCGRLSCRRWCRRLRLGCQQRIVQLFGELDI